MINLTEKLWMERDFWKGRDAVENQIPLFFLRKIGVARPFSLAAITHHLSMFWVD